MQTTNMFQNTRKGGFTLVELLVSMTVLSILMLLVSNVIGQAQQAWRQTSTSVSQFREARKAFDRMTSTLSQATLNTYWTYRFKGSTDPLLPPAKGVQNAPQGYQRYSELQFLCGPSTLSGTPKLTGYGTSVSPGHAVFFQAPLGTSSLYRMPTGLNACGYFIKYGNDAAWRPPFLDSKGIPDSYRYRLFEFRTSVEQNRIYDADPTNTVHPAVQSDWHGQDLIETSSRPIANNIVMLVISPRISEKDVEAGLASETTVIAPNYIYDSVAENMTSQTQHQLPPLVNVTMVAIDESSAAALQNERGTDSPLSNELSAASFTDATQLSDNLQTLEARLIAAKINFRIFSTTITLRASKYGSNTPTST